MIEIKHAIQDDYDNANAWCYGCGRLNNDGLHLRTGWEGNKTVTVYQPRDEHKAIPGFIYGGLIASVIDCHRTGSAAIDRKKHTSELQSCGHLVCRLLLETKNAEV